MSKLHSYLYVNRPPGPGCQPDGFDPDTREAWVPPQPVQHLDHKGRCFWGRVQYPYGLLYEQIHRYELLPEDRRERANMIFEREGTSADWLRDDYVAQPISRLLEYYEGGDPKAWAALVILYRGQDPSEIHKEVARET